MTFTILELLLAMFIFGFITYVIGFWVGIVWSNRNQTAIYRGLRKKILGDLEKNS